MFENKERKRVFIKLVIQQEGAELEICEISVGGIQ